MSKYCHRYGTITSAFEHNKIFKSKGFSKYEKRISLKQMKNHDREAEATISNM